MSNENNVDVIKHLFECIGSGKIPEALSLFAEKVDFRSPVTQTDHSEITWCTPRTTRSEVGDFFTELNEKMATEKMNIHSITSEGERVVVHGSNAGTVRSTEKTYDHEWIMLFRVDEGKITQNLHFYDTADLISAFKSW